VIVKAMVAHQQFQHHQHGQYGVRPRGKISVSPANVSEQSSNGQAQGVRYAVQ
jgi:hypothetical protein